MTDYAWPVDCGRIPVGGNFRVTSLSTISVSPYSGASIAMSLGQIWAASITWDGNDRKSTIEIQTFISKLEGPVNPVRIHDWWRLFPVQLTAQGFNPWSDGTFFDDGSGWAASGYSPLVSAFADRGAKTISTDAWPVSTKVMKRGDIFGVNGFMYEVTIDAKSDAAGATSLTFQPGLRESVADGDFIRLYRVNCRMRLMSDAEAAINRSLSLGNPFTLSFMEFVP